MEIMIQAPTARLMLKKRNPSSNKGDYGALSIVAGSRQFRGAAFLAALAALRSGAGIVRLCSVEPVVEAASMRLAEAIYLPLEESGEGAISENAISCLFEKASNDSAMLLGCGMGNFDSTKAIVMEAINELDMPLVLDADALNCLKGDISSLSNARFAPIITPHAGEMARLAGKPIEAIKADIGKAALDFAKEFGAIVVLKDSITAVAISDGALYLLDRPNPGLSKGGSGDALAGSIASFLAQGYSSEEAAVLGVWLNSEAAALCASEMSMQSMLPSDVIGFYPKVFLEWEEEA